jgi:dihydrodipicolinate synthase/N-acetylneuraminate lyase
MSVLALAALGAVLPPGMSSMPAHMVLSAPYTPTKADGALNASAENIDMLAAQASAFGVNTVWVPGSMGQFDTLTMDERKTLVELWAPAAKKHGLYLVAHVGSGSVGVAQELAQHAQRCGAPAIGTVPPFYESTTDVKAIASFLALVGAAAPTLPLFYYHIPAHTHASIQVFAQAAQPGILARPMAPNPGIPGAGVLSARSLWVCPAGLGAL